MPTVALPHLRQHHYFLLITRQPNAFRIESAVGAMGGRLVREQLPCIPPGKRWPPFINIPKVEAWQAAHTAFDLDAGRNVEYEPEMTSQARSVERMSHKDLNVSDLGPHVGRDPSYYARAAESVPRTLTKMFYVRPLLRYKISQTS